VLRETTSRGLCGLVCLQMDQIRFLFDGKRLRDSQTHELKMEDDEVIDTIDAIHFKLLMVEASPAFAVPLLVLVVNDRDGVQHRGTLQLPRRAPAAPGRRESPLPARLRPLMRALGNALLFLPAVMTTSGRISRDFLRLLYILSDRQAVNYFTRMGILDSSTKAYKQRRGTYFYYNRASIGVACAQATATRIDIAPHKHPRKKHTHQVPDHNHFHIPPYAHLHD